MSSNPGSPVVSSRSFRGRFLRGALSFRVVLFFSAPSGICIYPQAQASAISGARLSFLPPRAMRLNGARLPLRSLVFRRAGSRPERGWCGLCALVFRSWSRSVCACVWLALGSPGRRLPPGSVRLPRSVAG